MSTIKLEVCIDSLESARNAINGGADELEVCSSLPEGGLTPSPGLVKEVLKMKPIINVMIRCRGGSYSTFTEEEMTVMLNDIEFYKTMDVNRFVFGALTESREIDKVNCARVIKQAHPVPVTFHRAFDLCIKPSIGVKDIIKLGFDRILCSPYPGTFDNENDIMCLRKLLYKHSNKIEIVPGGGVNPDNVHYLSQAGFRIIHSSCKKKRIIPDFSGHSGENIVYVTDVDIVRRLKRNLKINAN